MKRLFKLKGTAATAAIVFGAAALYAMLRGLPSVVGFLRGLFEAAAPVTAGLGLAFVLGLPAGFLERRVFSKLRVKPRTARKLALVSTLALLIGSLAALFALILPRLGESARILAENSGRYLDSARALLRRVVGSFRGAAEADRVTELLIDSAAGRVRETAEAALERLPGMTVSAVTAVYRAVLTLVICVHTLVNREGLLRFLRRAATAVLPQRRIPGFFRGCSLANVTFRRYFSAQLISALMIGGAGYIGMRALGVPFPELIAVFCAFGALVPIVGPWVSIGVSALMTAASGGAELAVRFVILMLAIQLVEDNAVYPKLIGGAIGMTGLEVLASVIVAGGLMGLPGLLIAVPTVAVARRLIKSAVDARNAARAEAAETA